MRYKVLMLTFTLALIFDFLFWDQAQGISFFIFIKILLVIAYILLKNLGVPMKHSGTFFLIPIGFFTVMSFIHVEPFISFFNRALTLLFIGIWAASYQKGEWLRYGLIDYTISGLQLAFKMVSFPWLRIRSLNVFKNNENNMPHGFGPYFRGILLSLPILVIFTFIFASADMAFAELLQNFLGYINIDQIDEYLLRLLIVFIIANFFLGQIIFSVKSNERNKYFGEEKPFIKPFLGSIESGIILISVLALYLTFIILQFKYFFFNQSSIRQLGYTYSEYARSGFGELIAASVVSMGLILTLSAITVIPKKKDFVYMSWMHSGLISGNLIILISAFNRLSLYESAFGFTRLRTISHVYIIWLAVLLVAIGALVWLHKTRQFANLFIICTVGFAITLNVLNIDAFIVRQNLERFDQGHQLDITYLANLSSDAIPAIVKNIIYNEISSDLKIDLSITALCYKAKNQEYLKNNHWQAFSVSRYRANKFLKQIELELEDSYLIKDKSEIIVIDKNGKEYACTDFIFVN